MCSCKMKYQIWLTATSWGYINVNTDLETLKIMLDQNIMFSMDVKSNQFGTNLKTVMTKLILFETVRTKKAYE